MPVRIRLQRHGKKGKPFYWIVAADSRSKRDGRYLEKLGTYNPNTNPATVNVDVDGAIKWLEYDTKTNSDLVRNDATASKFSKLALGYALSSIGFIFFAYHTNAYSKVMALYATSAIPFIPLFALGIDWGRWLNFHFSSAVFICIALLISGSLKIEKNHSNIYLITFLLSNFIWSIGRVAPLTPFGVLGQAYRTLF